MAAKDVEPILKKMKLSKSALAKNAGVSPQVVTAICQEQPVLKKAGESVAKALGKDYSKLFRTEVDQTPLSTKTSNQRYIPLPDETFVLLKRYRISQMELQLANGDRWVHTDYVFTKSDGSPIGPDTITQ